MPIDFDFELATSLSDVALRNLRQIISFQAKSLEDYKQLPKANERAIRVREIQLKKLNEVVVDFATFREAALTVVGRAEAERRLDQAHVSRSTNQSEPERFTKEWWLWDMEEATKGFGYTRTEYLIDNPEAQLAIYGCIRICEEDYPASSFNQWEWSCP